ncbi:MAG: sulfatase [Planctomycetaceae bacterium]
MPDRNTVRFTASVVQSAILALLLLTGSGLCWAAEMPSKPNIVFILADNLGYGDLGFLGAKLHRTPHIDRMAKEGMTLRHFYSAGGVCTPSRAALMTGCYPLRVGLANPKPDGLVLRPVSPNGLHPDEVTIAEVLKSAGYATACIGKWHLGDQPPFLPTRQGFDRYFGIPYSEDMVANRRRGWPLLPLLENERVVEAPADRATLTQRYTKRAVQFIEKNRDRPFFLYLPHAVPGSVRAPFASKSFRCKSANGPYGDAVEELDWSTGVLLKRIRELGLAKRTLVVFTSDNGTPLRRKGGGSNAPLGGSGYTTAEGGMRVPCIAWWPGRVPAGTNCEELTTMMDWLPTLAELAGGKLPRNRVIDGKTIWPLLAGMPKARTPHQAFYYYQQDQLQAVRSGRWKLYLPNKGPLRRADSHIRTRLGGLFDVQCDPGEKRNVADKHAEIVRRLKKLAEIARRDLGDLKRPGDGRRPVGRVKRPVALRPRK